MDVFMLSCLVYKPLFLIQKLAHFSWPMLESMNSLLYPVRVYCMYVLMSYTPFIYRIILCDYSNNKHSVFSVTECWNEYTPVISSYSYYIAFSSIFTRDGRKLNWVCFGYSLRIICFTVYYVPQCIVFAPVILYSLYILQWRIETLYIMIVSWMRYRIYPRYIYIHTLEFNIICAWQRCMGDTCILCL